jgi:hypothetical protein
VLGLVWHFCHDLVLYHGLVWRSCCVLVLDLVWHFGHVCPVLGWGLSPLLVQELEVVLCLL